jgi:hypothetical protein
LAQIIYRPSSRAFKKLGKNTRSFQTKKIGEKNRNICEKLGTKISKSTLSNVSKYKNNHISKFKS